MRKVPRPDIMWIRHRTSRFDRDSARLGAFLLDESMSKSFFGDVADSTETIDVMSNLVDKNIIEIECAYGVEAVVAEFERMRTQKDALAPVNTVAAERTRPRPLLLARAGEKENGTKTNEMLGRHPVETLLDLTAFGGVDEVWCKRWQGDDPRESWLRRQPVVKALIC